MNPGCFQSQLVLASTWKAILRHDVLSSGFAVWMFFERSASAKKALKHNIHAEKHLEVNICIMYSKPCSSTAAKLMGGLGPVCFVESRNEFLYETNWKLGSTPTILNHICPPNQQVVILLIKINHTYHTFTYPWSNFTNWYSLKRLAPGLDEIFGDPNKHDKHAHTETQTYENKHVCIMCYSTWCIDLHHIDNSSSRFSLNSYGDVSFWDMRHLAEKTCWVLGPLVLRNNRIHTYTITSLYTSVLFLSYYI